MQVCSGVKVICDWGVLSVNSDSTVGDVFQGICTGQLDSPDGFCLEEQYADCPVSCSIVSTQVEKFQSISLCVSVPNAVEFGKYLKFVLQYRAVGPTTSRNALDVLMNEAGRLMFAATMVAIMYYQQVKHQECGKPGILKWKHKLIKSS